jgi:WD40 repeat protein
MAWHASSWRGLQPLLLLCMAGHFSDPPSRPACLKAFLLLVALSVQVLLDHSDEVWHLQFSHDGQMLASCGKDQTAIIWDVQPRSAANSSSPRDGGTSNSGSGTGRLNGGTGGSTVQVGSGVSIGSAVNIGSCVNIGSGVNSSSGHGGDAFDSGSGGSVVSRRCVLRGHSGPIAFLTWSPDDSKLATCGQDALRLWDVASGECCAVLRHHKDPVTCAAFFPDGQRLVTGSHDKQLCIVRLDGSLERQWRIQRMCVRAWAVGLYAVVMAVGLRAAR